MDPIERTCTVCGLTKPLVDFTPNKRSRYGRMKQCKACRNQLERERHAGNPQKRRDRRNAYRRTHPEVREHERVYEEANRERINRQVRERYAADRERYLASARAYRAHNQEKLVRYHRAWRSRNPEKVRAATQRHYRAHRQENMAANRRWCRAHPECMREKNRRYLRANPGAAIAMAQRRRARKIGAEGSFTAREWRALCDFYGRCCLCCGTMDRPLASDHVVPLSAGGTNYIFDIQPLCKHCNSVKGTKTVDYRTRSPGEFVDYLEAYPYRRQPKHKLLPVRAMADVVVGRQS